MDHFTYKFLIIFSTLCCYSYAQIGGNPFFREDYTYVKKLNAFYKEHNDKQDWYNALAICREEGADLLMPYSRDELDGISSFIKKDKYWLAYQDIYSEGTFVTVDGRSDDEIYINWADTEPNNGDNENCVTMFKENYSYNDYMCSIKMNYICKRNAANITRNELCETYDPGYKYTNVGDRCYKFHKTPTKWHSAFRVCKNEEAYLTILNSQNEAKLLVSMMERYPANSLKGNFDKNAMHLGFNDLLKYGTFITTAGQTLEEAGYDNWSVAFLGWGQQPDNLGGNEHCGSMFRDGTLNDIPCHVKTMFVCEKPLSFNGANQNSASPFAVLPDQE